jgi:hypothetical protein
MWRVHQLATMVLYIAVTSAVWWTKEFFKPNAMLVAVFVACGIASAAAGVMRGHLVFTSVLNSEHLPDERRRLRPVLVALDVLIAAGGAAAGLTLSMTRALAGVLIVGLTIGLALATVMMEPATTRAAFRQ